MSKIVISDKFDAGNIDVIDASNPQNIQLAIAKDNASEFLQWFYFRLEGEVGQVCTINIVNAAQSSYPDGWPDYNVCTSWDRQDWFRTPSDYQDGVLSFEIELQQNAVYFSYFAPYSHERHLDLLAWSQEDARVKHETLGQTIDGRAMSLLRICGVDEPKQKMWIIGRQHPGETMAEWFVEGFLHALLDDDNPLARKLLQTTAFYLVPNMNPDGSARGNLRTNAAGANLNREWQTPSMETSPEVYLVRERMMLEGGDMFLDIHGDEALPYNFVAGCEGNDSYDDAHALLEETFKDAYMAISPDFQDKHGYPKNQKGTANMTVAANWLGDHFRTLSYTIEMPFKDNADLPDPEVGWSPARAAQLGGDVLYPISKVLALKLKSK
ncbi:MAG: murein tripeptide amidase MpaA [Arenicella sp.]|jgi:murein tripeptide amidase MpaA